MRGDPAVEEGLHVGGAEPVADRLQPIRVGTGGEPVGQLGEGDARPAGLALGPLVAVDPHLGRIREVGADLDEAGTELAVEHVEVVDADPALRLGPAEVDATGRRPGVLGGAEHPLELLGGDDGHHPVAAGPFGSLQVGPDVIELAVIPAAAVGLLQLQDRDPMARGERLDLAPEAVADLLDQRRRADRVAEMTFQELVDLRRRPAGWARRRSGTAGRRTRPPTRRGRRARR